MVTKTRLTLDEFLKLPETEPPSEFIDGEIVQKMSPNWYHSRLVAELIAQLTLYLRTTAEGFVNAELRHISESEARSFLPDVEVTLKRNMPQSHAERGGAMRTAPDFAIEVLSPGDYSGRVLDRADFYMRIGTELLWIVDPELEAVTVYRPGQPPSVHRAPAALDGSPVLASFNLDLAELFAVLHEDEDESEA